MASTNEHGLSRTIPEGVKREIRKRCGFGCVICGFAFYDYEHFAPDFVDATEHNPDGMTLLCPNCNQKRARGRLSREAVASANQNPACIVKGYANEMFDFHSDPIKVVFAGVTFYNCTHLIVVNGHSLFSILPPQEENSPALLSGVFYDSDGRDALVIHENEWSVSTENWDVECIGPKITIRNAPGNIVLVLKLNPPQGITIERLDMFFDGIRLRGNNEFLETSTDGIRWARWTGCNMSHSRVGIEFQTRPNAANDPIWSDI